MVRKTNYWMLILLVFSVLLLPLTGCNDDEEEEADLYTLTLSMTPEDYGSISDNVSGDYEEGEEVYINASPYEDYGFYAWMDGEEIESYESAYVFTMPAENISLTAEFIVADGTTGTVSDVDGNQYTTVYAGGMEWMAENLNSTQYNDGSDIAGGLSNEDWADTEQGAYAVYPHQDVDGIDSENGMEEAYGRLYNWYAVNNDKGICPSGWHVPEDEELSELMDYLTNKYSGVSENNVGNFLKSCRQVNSPEDGNCATSVHPRWNANDTHYGTDDIGFNALPAGERSSNDGEFNNIGHFWNIWTATEENAGKAWRWWVRSNAGSLFHLDAWDKNRGYSVRCVRDAGE
ncbi:MAG: FISUMP domain-containing protein [Bacteroidales bacterium]